MLMVIWFRGDDGMSRQDMADTSKDVPRLAPVGTVFANVTITIHPLNITEPRWPEPKFPPAAGALAVMIAASPPL